MGLDLHKKRNWCHISNYNGIQGHAVGVVGAHLQMLCNDFILARDIV